MEIGSNQDDKGTGDEDIFGLRSTISKKHFVQIDMQEREEKVVGEEYNNVKTNKVSTSGGGIIDDEGEEGLLSARPMLN